MQTVRNQVEGTGASIGPVLIGIPETTMFGFYMLIRACLGGHPIMWIRGDATRMLEHAVRLGVREFMVTPVAVSDLAAAVEAGAAKPDLARIVIFGAITSRGLFQRVEAAFGVPVAISLGASETGQTSYGITTSNAYLPGWSGKPLSTVGVKVADATTGGSGRILLRCNPWIGSEGYLGGEPIFDAEGWFESGDIGRILPDGNLMIEGRADNLINLGGSKYAAELIEMLASGSPGVRAVVAVRLPENAADRAELGLAVVADDGFDPEALRVLLGLKLKTRAPMVIRPVPSIPMLPSGKIDRRAVGQAFEN